MKKNGLVIFSKYPEEGKIKTRLAVTLGNEKALKFYNLCAHNTFSEASKLDNNVNVFLFYSDKEDKKRIKQWIDKDFVFLHQHGADLGKRMLIAFKELFDRGIEKVVIIGTDIPDMNVRLIRTAFDYLEKFDVVIGPTPDGGYYLLGMKKLIPELFSGIAWSTEEVYAKTMIKIIELGKNVKTLPKLLDIDTEEDLNVWLNSETSIQSYLYNEISSLLEKQKNV